jgi:hypothetical protein
MRSSFIVGFDTLFYLIAGLLETHMAAMKIARCFDDSVYTFSPSIFMWTTISSPAASNSVLEQQIYTLV